VRRKVGAIIVDEKYHILSTGYNGVPSGFKHCIDEPCIGAKDPTGNSERCMAVHAEVNAMLQCSRINDARTLYVSCTPCIGCAKMICNTPIKRIIASSAYADNALYILHLAEIELIIAKEYIFEGVIRWQTADKQLLWQR